MLAPEPFGPRPPQLRRAFNGDSGAMKRVFVPKALAIAGAVAIGSIASAQITISPTTTAFTDISVTGTSPGVAADDSELNVTAAALIGAGFAGNELLPLGVGFRIGNNGAVLWNTQAVAEVGYINSTNLPGMA